MEQEEFSPVLWFHAVKSRRTEVVRDSFSRFVCTSSVSRFVWYTGVIRICGGGVRDGFNACLQRILISIIRRLHALQFLWMCSWDALSPHSDRWAIHLSDKIFLSSCRRGDHGKEGGHLPGHVDFGRPLALFCLFVFVVHSLHHYTPIPWIYVERQLFIEWFMPEYMFIEWALCAVGALVMFSGILVLTSIIWCQLVDNFMPSCSPTSRAVGTRSSR